VVVAIPLFGIVSNTFTAQTTNSAAGFGQATYAFTDATLLTLGARLTAESKHIDASGSVYVTAPGLSIPQGPIHGSITATRPTWRAALDHKLTADTMVYVSYNRGFKSGGFAPANTNVVVSFEPEALDAFEVGIKSEIFDRRLRINAASFYYDYRNIQLVSYTTGFSSIYNGKSAKIYGLDMDLTAAATDHLTFTLGLSLLHDRFGDFPIGQTAQLPTGGIVPLPEAVSAEGKRLPNTPDWQLNAGAEYSIPLSGGSVVLAADFFHSDKWYSTPENRTFQKPYNLTNASATWLFGPPERHSLKLWGRGLGNVAYAVQSAIQAPTGDLEAVGEGRTFGVTLGTKF
jgi:iron complex outermembrane receptor protein